MISESQNHGFKSLHCSHSSPSFSSFWRSTNCFLTFDFRDFLTKVETKQRLCIIVTPSKTEPRICGEWASIICARPLWCKICSSWPNHPRKLVPWHSYHCSGPSAIRQSVSICQILSSLYFKLSIPKTAPCQLTWTKVRLAALISGPQEGTIIVQHGLITLMIPLRHSGISILKFCLECTCEPIQVVSYSNILQHRIWNLPLGILFGYWRLSCMMEMRANAKNCWCHW